MPFMTALPPPHHGASKHVVIDAAVVVVRLIQREAEEDGRDKECNPIQVDNHLFHNDAPFFNGARL
jgi:hypothetical protein